MLETVGFIGLGNMGEPIAANLLASGYPLRVFSRDTRKTASLVAQGAAQSASSAGTAVSGGLVITMLSDDRALEEIAMGGDELARALGPGGIHVSMSTVSPEASRRVAAHHARFGVSYLASPVFGRPEAAAARKLWICLSGAAKAKERVLPLLQILGQSIFDFGEDAGSANVVKLAGNFMIASAVEAMAEAMAFSQKNGIDSAGFIEMMGQTLFACVVYQNYGKALVNRKYDPPGFRLALGLKDVDLVLKTASESKTPMPLASLLHDRLISSVAKGRGELDWSILGQDVAEQAGI